MISNFQGTSGDNRYCTVHSNDPGAWILRHILWLVPILTTTFVTIPLFLGHHAQLKAIGDLWHLSHEGTRHSHPNGRCCRDDHGMGAHGHGSTHGSNHGQGSHHSHGGGLGCSCGEFLFGTNFTNFGEILKEVCEMCSERHRILMQIRSQIQLALKLFPEGVSDLVTRTGKRAKRVRNIPENGKNRAHSEKESKISGIARIGQQVLRGTRLQDIFAGKPPKTERALTEDLEAMWIEDEARGSPRFRQLVREYLDFLSACAPVTSAHNTVSAASESPSKELPIGSCLFGINLLLKFRLPVTAGRPLSVRMEHELAKWLDHDHDGAVSLRDFTDFLVPPSSIANESKPKKKNRRNSVVNVAHATLAAKTSWIAERLPIPDSGKSQLLILQEKLRLQTVRTRELEQRLAQLEAEEDEGLSYVVF